MKNHRLSGKVLLTAGGLILSSLASSAGAGYPGAWTRIETQTIGNINDFGLARTADGVLHVVWTENTGAFDYDLMHRTVSIEGVVSAPNIVDSGFSFMNWTPDLVVRPDGGLQAFYGGSKPNENGGLHTSTSDASGATWTHGGIVANQTGWSGDVSAIFSTDGTSFQASSGKLHRGLSPASGYVDYGSQLPDAAAHDRLARDTASGELWVAWFAQGVYVQEIDPSTGQMIGQPLLMPGSVTDYQGTPYSNSPGRRIAFAARNGGGLYVAFPTGYPGVDKVRVWKVGDATSTVIARPGTTLEDSSVTLTPTPDGRLWVLFGVEASPSRLFAAISNDTVTGWSPAISTRLPGGGYGDWFGVEADASAKRVDVFANTASVERAGLFHTQFDQPPEWGPGTDTWRGGAGSDFWYGGPGDDTVAGNGGADKLYGGDGADRIDGGRGIDVLSGGRGRDICLFTRGDKMSGCEVKRLKRFR